jgi:DivIVA domain-containing protein
LALDRQSIEKRDFPIGRRGYEPEAVDAHLARLAEAIDQLQRRGGATDRPSPASLASAASEQVRTIVEAAETSAQEIERQARQDAADIQADAEADARQTREDALAQSRSHLGRVQEASQLMLQRVDAMESELTALIESLRTGGNRLNADLSLLEGNLGELYDSAGAGSRSAAGNTPAPDLPPVVAAVVEEVVVVEPDFEPEPEPVPAPTAEAEPFSAPEPPAGEDQGDVEGARLVALNMALNGTSREDTDRYLADNFDLSDRRALLDEVYATIEG